MTENIKVVTSSDLLSPSRNQLELWCAELPAVDSERAQKMKSEQRFHQFVLGRKLLQLALAEFYNLPLAIQLREGGKPEAEGAAVSLSHSGVRIAVAVTQASNPLGIDLEVYKKRNFMRLARHYFAPEEVAELELLPELEQRHCFFKFWVLKESLAKFTGAGLSSQLLRSAFIEGGKSIGPVSYYSRDSDCALALTASDSAAIDFYEAVLEGDALSLRPQARQFQRWQPPLL